MPEKVALVVGAGDAIGSAIVRSILMVALIRYVQSPVLFPLAFSMLVMGKTYAVAKSALVPSTVSSQEALVRSNSRLATRSCGTTSVCS